MRIGAMTCALDAVACAAFAVGALVDLVDVACSKRELYQWEVFDTREWLQALRADRPIFWEMAFTPSQERVFAVASAQAFGGWVDEATGRRRLPTVATLHPILNVAVHQRALEFVMFGARGAQEVVHA
ncbi:MAG: hypothetical protein JO057_24380 [Chloroflexi bacterium]|nr:hypothetical protein [Chloroflexota bacterium]